MPLVLEYNANSLPASLPRPRDPTPAAPPSLTLVPCPWLPPLVSSFFKDLSVAPFRDCLLLQGTCYNSQQPCLCTCCSLPVCTRGLIRQGSHSRARLTPGAYRARVLSERGSDCGEQREVLRGEWHPSHSAQVTATFMNTGQPHPRVTVCRARRGQGLGAGGGQSCPDL